MKGADVQLYQAVLGELQFLRDDARPKNNNCKLKEKAVSFILTGVFRISVPLAERGGFDNRGKTTEGIQSTSLI